MPALTPSRAPVGLLVAAVVFPCLELLRALSPMLDTVAGSHGVPTAAATAVAVFAAVGVAAPLAGMASTRQALLVLPVAVVLLRVAVQFPQLRTLGAMAVATTVVLLTLTAAVRRCVAESEGGPKRAAQAIAVAVAVDVAVRATVLQTWDPIWRTDVAATVVVAAQCALLIAATAALARRAGRPKASVNARVGVLGPALALYVVFLASPAFVASQVLDHDAVMLPAPAVAAVGIAAATGFGLVWSASAQRPLLPALVFALAVPTAVLAIPVVSLIGVAAALIAGPAVLSHALTPRRKTPSRPVLGGAVAGLGAGLGYVLVALPYQAHYETPLPVPNVVFPAAAALVLAGIAAWRPARSRDVVAARSAQYLAAAGALVAAVGLTQPAGFDTEPSEATDEFRLLSWNIHYGADSRGEIGLEAVAEVIEDSEAEVVVLQEVARGWPIGGGVDQAVWLSQRLEMNYAWAPAADRQFGNLILSRLPLEATYTEVLDRGEGSMDRSFASAQVQLSSGAEVQVLTTHLQHRDVPDTRLAQIDRMLRHWDDNPAAVVAGDLNAEPGWPEIDAFVDAGFRSAQDELGDPTAKTSPTQTPLHRVDWIMGAEGVEFTDFALLDTTVSDHFPLQATVRHLSE